MAQEGGTNVQEMAKSRFCLQSALHPLVHSSQFAIAKEELMAVITTCQNRSLSEEVDMVEKKGGNQWLFDGLGTSEKGGISTADIEAREQAFGHNKPDVRQPKS